MVATLLVEVPAGFEDVAREEIRVRLQDAVRFEPGRSSAGELFVNTDAPFADLQKVTTLKSIYLRYSYDAPRLRSLLARESLERIARQARAAERFSGQPFRSFRLEGAGDESATFQRLEEELAKALALPLDREQGELKMRVRPAQNKENSWEVLTRVTPRPLSVRSWRVGNYAGALAAPAAAAVVRVLGVHPGQRILNVMSGSGTLVIEGALHNKKTRFVGVEIDREAIAIAVKNFAAARIPHRVALLEGDARSLPFSNDSFDAAMTDLPWGERVGSRRSNMQLYREALLELNRVVVPKGRVALISQDADSLVQALQSMSPSWRTVETRRFSQSGFWPYLFIVERLARKSLREHMESRQG